MRGQKGTCLQTYIPIRAEASSSSEIVSSLIFGESYIVNDTKENWLSISTFFDDYSGWISANTFNEYVELTKMNDLLYIEAVHKTEKMFIPCGALIPDTRFIKINDMDFEVKPNLKPNHHLPLRLQIEKVSKSFLNTPYLWGGRTFMGIDCSGFVQIVFKTLKINLPRDTSQQIFMGEKISFNALNTGDLVFFSAPNKEKVSHVGIMLNKKEVIHASGTVRISLVNEKGISNKDGLEYALISCNRIF